MIRIRLCGFLIAAFCLSLTACEKPPPLPPEDHKGGAGGNETLRGKVTYQGRPVPYGLVLVFNETSIDPKTGKFTFIAMGAIGEDGSYEIVRLPTGGVEIVVLTCPDVESSIMLHPMLPGEDPATGMVGPSSSEPPVSPPNEFGPPPATGHLTETQKKELRVIHSKYGGYGKKNFGRDIKPGEQTFNIELK